MDFVVEYVQAIYNANRRSGSFVIDIAKTVEALNTKVFITDHRMIVQAINMVVKESHTSTINTARTHIDVAIIGK
jgi:hypothetical protein